jgi:hypothetical protein
MDCQVCRFAGSIPIVLNRVGVVKGFVGPIAVTPAKRAMQLGADKMTVPFNDFERFDDDGINVGTNRVGGATKPTVRSHRHRGDTSWRTIRRSLRNRFHCERAGV